MQGWLFEHRTDVSEVLIGMSKAEYNYIKFLSANDLNLTGSHQHGIYMTKDSWPMFQNEAGRDGENTKTAVRVQWDGGHTTTAEYSWFGQGTRNEYRLTQIHSYFRGQEESALGNLLILSRQDGSFKGYTLDNDEDIESILNFFGIAATEAKGLVRFDLDKRLKEEFEIYIGTLSGGFPETENIARKAQSIYENLYGDAVRGNPDESIIKLIEIEYSLFRYIEEIRYGEMLTRPFGKLEALLSASLEINNRRKSRAGKSLELHLRYIFNKFNIRFSHGETTGENKRPDFIFPGVNEYNDPDYPEERLFMLGAKTTCKDRWRQVLNEADRISSKYIFTLQQGISSAQLREMNLAKVIPVIPLAYQDRCKVTDRDKLMSLQQFLDMLLEINGEELSLF